jgi:hypothetical protein
MNTRHGTLIIQLSLSIREQENAFETLGMTTFVPDTKKHWINGTRTLVEGMAALLFNPSTFAVEIVGWYGCFVWIMKLTFFLLVVHKEGCHMQYTATHHSGSTQDWELSHGQTSIPECHVHPFQ